MEKKTIKPWNSDMLNLCDKISFFSSSTELAFNLKTVITP